MWLTWLRQFWPFCLLKAHKTRNIPRERYLFPQEWTAIKAVLDVQALKIRVYFYLLLLEGPRLSELRLMERTHVDLQAGLWFKPITKTRKAQTLALSQPACLLLAQLPNDSPFFFPGESPSVPWSKTAVEYHWRKIRWLAGCPDVQIRDLRRTFATWMTIHGENLLIVKEILHHKSVATTQIYARVDHATVRGALNRHGARVVPPLPE